MITHDEYIFCLCEIDKRIKLTDHGYKFLVGMEVGEDGSQLGPASLEQWGYEFNPPVREEVLSFWENNKHNFLGMDWYATSLGLKRVYSLLEFRDLLSKEEKVAMKREALKDLEMSILIDDLHSMPEVNLDDMRVKDILGEIKSRGILSSERVKEILNPRKSFQS